jgi:hypothetical protein
MQNYGISTYVQALMQYRLTLCAVGNEVCFKSVIPYFIVSYIVGYYFV